MNALARPVICTVSLSKPSSVRPAPPQPARWKMTVVLWLMAYPMITGLGLALNPLLKERSPLVRNLVTTAIFVPFMVYGGVPSARRLINKLEESENQEKADESIS